MKKVQKTFVALLFTFSIQSIADEKSGLKDLAALKKNTCDNSAEIYSTLQSIKDETETSLLPKKKELEENQNLFAIESEFKRLNDKINLLLFQYQSATTPDTEKKEILRNLKIHNDWLNLLKQANENNPPYILPNESEAPDIKKSIENFIKNKNKILDASNLAKLSSFINGPELLNLPFGFEFKDIATVTPLEIKEQLDEYKSKCDPTKRLLKNFARDCNGTLTEIVTKDSKSLIELKNKISTLELEIGASKYKEKYLQAENLKQCLGNLNRRACGNNSKVSILECSGESSATSPINLVLDQSDRVIAIIDKITSSSITMYAFTNDEIADCAKSCNDYLAANKISEGPIKNMCKTFDAYQENLSSLESKALTTNEILAKRRELREKSAPSIGNMIGDAMVPKFFGEIFPFWLSGFAYDQQLSIMEAEGMAQKQYMFDYNYAQEYWKNNYFLNGGWNGF